MRGCPTVTDPRLLGEVTSLRRGVQLCHDACVERGRDQIARRLTQRVVARDTLCVGEPARLVVRHRLRERLL